MFRELGCHNHVITVSDSIYLVYIKGIIRGGGVQSALIHSEERREIKDSLAKLGLFQPEFCVAFQLKRDD